jgi:hypothetical protein
MGVMATKMPGPKMASSVQNTTCYAQDERGGLGNGDDVADKHEVLHLKIGIQKRQLAEGAAKLRPRVIRRQANTLIVIRGWAKVDFLASQVFAGAEGI